MTQQVERDVAQGDVFFEFGRPSDPPAELLRQDEGVVAELQRILRGVVRGDRVAVAGEFGGEFELVDRYVHIVGCAHKWGTPSDAV